MRVGRTVASIAGMALAFGAVTLGVTACGGKSGTGGGGGGAPASTDSGVVAKAKKDKRLIIGVKSDQPGLGLQTGGRYEGFDIEIAKIIAKGLGVDEANIEWKTTVSANREPFIQQGTVDLVVATYTINDDRKQKVSF